MYAKSLYDAKQMHAAMKALVGESPHADVKNIFGLEGNVEVRLCCMIFEIVPAQEDVSIANLLFRKLMSASCVHLSCMYVRSQLCTYVRTYTS